MENEMPSDFGTVVDYALMLEGSIPAGDAMKFEAIRPAVMGMTKRQKEEAEKLAAMEPEDRQKAQAEIAKRNEEARAKFEEDRAKQQAAAQAAAPKPPPPPPAPAPEKK
jgi:hypothetical protein